jgi:DNA-binding XRE family transcriptional regulator
LALQIVEELSMEMIINLNRLVLEKNKRAWTQSHLAEVSDLSLRTIQRIEKTGTASHETIKSLAAVFEIQANDLMYTENTHNNNKTTFPNINKINFKNLFSNLFVFAGFSFIVYPFILLFYNTIFEPGIPMIFTEPDMIKKMFSDIKFALAYLLPPILFFGVSIIVFKNKNMWVIGFYIFYSLLEVFYFPWFSLVALSILAFTLYSRKDIA